MPQMAPLSWTLLMMIFILTLLIINTIMYFNKIYKTEMKINKKMTNMMNWKW